DDLEGPPNGLLSYYVATYASLQPRIMDTVGMGARRSPTLLNYSPTSPSFSLTSPTYSPTSPAYPPPARITLLLALLLQGVAGTQPQVLSQYFAHRTCLQTASHAHFAGGYSSPQALLINICM